MATIGGILATVGIIASFVFFIMVLIQIFKKEGVGLGILGIFCSIYAYIWGWIKSRELGLKKVMLGWTASFLVIFIGYALILTSPEARQALQDAQRQQSSQPVESPNP